MGRWTNTTTYPNLPAPDDADILPIADVSATEGARQRTITWAQLLALLAAGATINSHAGNHTLHETNDAGAYVRITAAGTVTLPNSFPTGWQATVVNATDAADVEVEATGTLTLPADVTPFIVNRRAITVIHVGSNVWEAHGAFVEGS